MMTICGNVLILAEQTFRR